MLSRKCVNKSYIFNTYVLSGFIMKKPTLDDMPYNKTNNDLISTLIFKGTVFLKGNFSEHPPFVYF